MIILTYYAEMLPQTQLKTKAIVKAVNTGKNNVFIADLVTPKGSFMAFNTDRATLGKKASSGYSVCRLQLLPLDCV